MPWMKGDNIHGTKKVLPPVATPLVNFDMVIISHEKSHMLYKKVTKHTKKSHHIQKSHTSVIVSTETSYAVLSSDAVSVLFVYALL